MRSPAGLFVIVTVAALFLFDTATAGFARSRSSNDTPAGAPTKRESVVVVSGMVRSGEYAEFAKAVARGNPDLVMMNGPGGLLAEALLIAEEIRRRGLNTMVSSHQYCASACAVMFLAGRTKYLSSGAALGLHAAGDLYGRPDAEGTMLMAAYLRQVGVPLNVLVRMAQTSPREIWWLDRAAQRSLKIRYLGRASEQRRSSRRR